MSVASQVGLAIAMSAALLVASFLCSLWLLRRARHVLDAQEERQRGSLLTGVGGRVMASHVRVNLKH